RGCGGVGTPGAVPRVAPEPGQPPVSGKTSLLTGSRITLHELRIDGVTDLPTVDGTIRVVKFSMSKSVTDDFVLRVPGGTDHTAVIRSSALTLDGNATFYATRFVGWILGVKLTLTPESPLPPDGIPLPAPVVVLSDPEIQLVFAQTDELRAPNLDHTA
ncbi:MAG TPA: hypothetical protein VGD43_02340, partial [Micromonospora sp.]